MGKAFFVDKINIPTPSFLFLENKKRRVVQFIPVNEISKIRVEETVSSKLILIQCKTGLISLPAENAEEVVSRINSLGFESEPIHAKSA